MHTDQVVIGIDGGGTHTRVMVSDLKGNARSIVTGKAASFHKDAQATQNVREAIVEALHAAGRTTGQVRGLAAGIAGYDSPSDLEWIAPLTDLPGLACPKWHVNDAVAAHAGALTAQPGIIVIAGTGSNTLGVTEDGRFVCNYDFGHYAASAARFIAYDAVFETIAGHADDTDRMLVQQMLTHWDTPSMDEFAALARRGFDEDKRARDKRFGEFAPFLTAAAEEGSSVAARVCMRAIAQMKVGIGLVATAFAEDEVAVSFIGSVANSPYFRRALNDSLASGGNNKRYTVIEPQFPPVVGSVLLALKKLNIPIDETVLSNLHASGALVG